MRIVIDDKIPYIKGVFEPYAEVVYCPAAAISAAVVKHADALIVRTRTQCNQALLEGSAVRFIASATIGFDHIDTDYCKRANIGWCNAPGSNASSVAQYVLSALLYLQVCRNVPIAQKTMGIIGVGNVGSRIKTMAELLGMRVLLNDPPRAANEGSTGFCALEELLPQVDFVSLHVPLTRTGEHATLGMADKSFFKPLKPAAVLLNTSRGEVIHEEALIKALSQKQLSHAILDVWNNEPDINPRLVEQVTIATPHIAGYSADGKAMAAKMSVEAVANFFSLPINYQLTNYLPQPANPLIQIDCAGLSPIEALYQAVKATYDIAIDNHSLRINLLQFEQLRGAYYVRCEPLAYTVALKNSTSTHQKLIDGFFSC